MRKFRLIATIVMSILIFSALSFGIYVISKPKMGVLNSTSFSYQDNHVFIDLYATYEGPELSSRYKDNVSYGFTLPADNEEALKDDPADISPWSLGNTTFSVKERFIKLTFKITNLNPEFGVKVTYKNLAYDSQKRFSTSYNIVSGEDAEFDDDRLVQIGSGTNKKASIPAIQLAPNEVKKIQIVYELKRIDQEIKDFENNIECIFESIIEED